MQSLNTAIKAPMALKKKILYVDDSATQLLMGEMILKSKYNLITAANGEEGVKKAAHENPDLILMDVVMPVMNGHDALIAIRKNGATSRIPVIMVTTRAELENIEKAYSNGCNDYVTKPLDSIELTQKIKNLIGL